MFLSIIPFVFIIFAILFWAFRVFILKTSIAFYKEEIFTTWIIIIVSIQPTIINSLINLISCSIIDQEYYLKSYQIEICYTPDHYKWIFNLFVPSFLFYSFFVPFILLGYMIKYRNEIYKPLHMRRIGFISNGYSQNKFYWFKLIY